MSSEKHAHALSTGPSYGQDNGQRWRVAAKLERYIGLVPSIAFNAVLQAFWYEHTLSLVAFLLTS